MPLSPDDFGASFKNFINQMADTSEDGSSFKAKLSAHFECEPNLLAVMSEKFLDHERPNWQLSIDEYLRAESRTHELIGVAGNSMLGTSLLDMLSSQRAKTGFAVTEGPVSYSNVEIDNEKAMPCVIDGLYLISEGDSKLAVLVAHEGARGLSMSGSSSPFKVEVLAANRLIGERFLREMRTLMRKLNVYAGRTLSCESNLLGAITLKFREVSKIERDQIILPPGLLERIEKSTISFSRNSEQLLKWKRHLKRGLLLYGAPGTGKTLTAAYLSKAMSGRTVLVMTGRGMGGLEQTCSLARALQPSMVLIEDVDLIAEDRRSEVGYGFGRPLLMDLMNEMDGLADDCDVVFLLTTNRPEVLEPALATRPGRIDQAFELPLPDAHCRNLLFKLYSDGLPLNISDFSNLVERTAGASPAFIKELLRTSACFAADEESEFLEERHVQEALHELVVAGGKLSRTIVGFQTDAVVVGIPDPNAS